MSTRQVLRVQTIALADSAEPGGGPPSRSDAETDAATLATRWLAAATDHLRQSKPDYSAAGPPRLWQIVAIAGVVAAVGAALLAESGLCQAVLCGLITLPFLAVTALRFAALRQSLKASPTRASEPRAADAELPVYTVLVPLFREAGMVPGLVAALRALDYPPDRLDIALVLEAVDRDTQDKLRGMSLPAHIRTVIVPDAEPRTKPKALNYALRSARGTYLVIFDAEDRPEPDQLRRAVARFASTGADLACLQAHLNIYNPDDTWFTRQFAVEYTVLFDAMLPALERLRIPLPLGGTSNHFRRAALDAAGGWDPFNVTEDADLGVRLARLGYRTSVLESTTWEEAPAAFMAWLRQRTRWLKGWMQTYLVHTRAPLLTYRQLGPRGFAGFHLLMGGLILSALVHPLFYAMLAYRWLLTDASSPAPGSVAQTLWAVSWCNLALGYLLSMAVGMIAVTRRGRAHLVGATLALPLYWLLISAAAYRAILQLVRSPYLWEKTPHGSAASPVGAGERQTGPNPA